MQIVILDGSAVERRLTRKIVELIEQGAEIIEFADGNEALMFCKNNNPDIIFADVNGGSIDGISFVKYLWDIQKVHNILITSGQKNNEHNEKNAVECFKLNVSDFLLKPLTLASVDTALHNLRYAINS